MTCLYQSRVNNWILIRYFKYKETVKGFSMVGNKFESTKQKLTGDNDSTTC